MLSKYRKFLPLLFSLGVLLFFWQFVITPYMKEIFFPSPLRVIRIGIELSRSGILLKHIEMSLIRVSIGFAVGSLIAIPIGLLMGEVRWVRNMVEPYVNFFRSIPPIAYISLAIIWFGIGETAKIFLIIYCTVFCVIINTYFGVTTIPQNRYRAALSLGANNIQLFFRVTVPGSMAHILTGMRIAMGLSFMTIIAAEMLAADEGLGYLIYSARLFMLTDRIFLGIIVLGMLGIVLDKIFRILINKFAGKFTYGTI